MSQALAVCHLLGDGPVSTADVADFDLPGAMEPALDVDVSNFGLCHRSLLIGLNSSCAVYEVDEVDAWDVSSHLC